MPQDVGGFNVTAAPLLEVVTRQSGEQRAIRPSKLGSMLAYAEFVEEMDDLLGRPRTGAPGSSMRR